MVELIDRPRLGPYILTRRLSAGVLGHRWLALDERDSTSHLVHRLRLAQSNPTDEAHAQPAHTPLTMLHAVQQTAALEHAHILRIEAAALDTKGRPFAVTPYTGDSDGVLTLDTLLRRKGGYMPVDEAKRAMLQLLGAVRYAHEQGLAHGPISLPEIHVDPRGSLVIELYGVVRLLSGHTAALSRTEIERAEVRSVFEIGYQLVTGLRPERPIIPAGRVMAELDQSWDDVFETGLGDTGFTTAAHALSAVQSLRVSVDAGKQMGRVRWAIKRILFAGA
jgi:serine/threonine protein kinase